MKRLIIWAGIFSASTGTSFGQQVTQATNKHDPRLQRLTRFLEAMRSPFSKLAPEFLAAADRHHLDWRLLPSISVVETGAGRAARKNNIFGWDSARRGFNTVREGIYTVAERLANSRLYRDKELDELLATYNSRPEYPARVRAVMMKVDPGEPLRARSVIQARLSPDDGLQNTERPEPEQ